MVSIEFGDIDKDETVSAVFEVEGYVTRGTVVYDLEEPIFIAGGYATEEEVPPPEAQPVCGNGIIEGDEECDNTTGVPEGYYCTKNCTLERLPEKEEKKELPPTGEVTVEEAREAGGLVGLVSAVVVIVIVLLVTLMIGAFLYTKYSKKRRKKPRIRL